jgi:GntR family transcriptional repressor for pyruvate dehydrogenase complex
MTNSGSKLKIVPPARSGQSTEQVVARVYELIKRADLKPGDRLLPERELSKQLGISRPALRAGLGSLISMGVLQSRQGAGTFIVDGPPALDSEPLRLLAQLHGFSFEHMFETRSMLEVGAAGLAAERATGEQLATMSKQIADMFASLKIRSSFWCTTSRFIARCGRVRQSDAGDAGRDGFGDSLRAASRDDRARARLQRSARAAPQIYRAIRARKPEERAKRCASTSFERSERLRSRKQQQQNRGVAPGQTLTSRDQETPA